MDIESLLKIALKHHASDVHILPGMPPSMRVDGELIPIPDQPALTTDASRNLVYSLFNPEQEEQFEEKLVLDFALNFPHLGNFRVSTLHQLRGVAAVLRIIPEDVPTFDELELPMVLKRILTLSHGIVLVAGPTGSGKSTTQAAMLDYINANQSGHIITIEDPIEYIHTSKKSAINQIQIGRDTPDAPTALRSALRQDPDVILIGEMRDLETIRLALTAAETGHLVLSTLHASSAPLVVSRVVDVFPSDEKNRIRNLLAETIQGVICQSLIKRVPEGRVAAFEIMLATPAIRHLIRQDMTAHMETTIQTSGDIGMCTLEQYLQKLVAKRLITPATAKLTAASREGFKTEGGSKV